jgi:hypothetical protein
MLPSACTRAVEFAGGCATHAAAGSQMMFFFSNRLGCLGSILVSVIGTLVLLLLLGIIRLG